MAAWVEFLADDAMEGRSARHAGGRRAARCIARAFEDLGLEQVPGVRGWFQDVGTGLSPNVLGLVRGRDPGFLVISAHYDHLPPLEEGRDRIFNGADDNASGVAAVIELAGYFRRHARGGRRRGVSLLFAAFTGEELDLLGSEKFVTDPPVALAEIRGDINLDMISRGRRDLIFCEPGGSADRLLEAVLRANAALGELEVRVGDHPEWLEQSDQES
ncbi:MAG TPA: M28 family peptidase, partial [Planctomycetes bacterium]|nr:M28 family peptidase [Planctomycetota bacterium]